MSRLERGPPARILRFNLKHKHHVRAGGARSNLITIAKIYPTELTPPYSGSVRTREISKSSETLECVDTEWARWAPQARQLS